MSNQTTTGRKPLSRKAALIALAVAAPLLLWLEFGKPTFSADPLLSDLVNMTLPRLLGAVVFFALMLADGYRILSPVRGLRPVGAFLLLFLPPLAVVINNFPIPALITGDAQILPHSAAVWVWFSLECLAISLFEEAAFRGVIFPMLAERRCKTKRGLFISILLTSAVFGLLHIVNLAQGAGIGAVVRQIGYSFLIGAMCSVVLIKTHNIWLCVLLHAVFDFGGKLIDTLGAGKIWTLPAILITTVLAVLTTLHLTWQFFRPDPVPFEEIYPPKTPSNAE